MCFCVFHYKRYKNKYTLTKKNAECRGCSPSKI